MRPRQDDVQQMVAALMTVMGSLERARQKGDANTLAVLHIVAVRQRVRPSDIALELGIHQSTVTRQVQSLEEAGHVAATVDPEDRRSCLIELTQAGLIEIKRLTEIGLSRFAEFVADWEAEEVRTLGRLLVKLEDSKAKIRPVEQRPSGRRWQKTAVEPDHIHALENRP